MTVQTLICGAAGTATFFIPFYTKITKKSFRFWSIRMRTLMFRAANTVTFFIPFC
ncbi:hypothetical protein PoMZ_05893 [Pyricularia oryzae]|uniref:Uncharacterized protein n=1 Tax=Pyricularia oryzae TaxID=318829 RepID=A0A4P7NPN9_PYROR|nr:hypothetical protein PoMZ_05893 [Pyricularia oryzae]